VLSFAQTKWAGAPGCGRCDGASPRYTICGGRLLRGCDIAPPERGHNHPGRQYRKHNRTATHGFNRQFDRLLLLLLLCGGGRIGIVVKVDHLVCVDFLRHPFRRRHYSIQPFRFDIDRWGHDQLGDLREHDFYCRRYIQCDDDNSEQPSRFSECDLFGDIDRHFRLGCLLHVFVFGVVVAPSEYDLWRHHDDRGLELHKLLSFVG
jgi:hypothetical protein